LTLEGGDIMLLFYKNIKKRRLEIGMSQEELAQKTGYTSRSSIAKIEKGEVDLQLSKIKLFANALRVSQSELMGLEGIATAATAEFLADLTLDPELLEYTTKLSKMPNSHKHKVYGYIDRIVEEIN
jgi:transcriptional regulator with XRE-family HTH domain